MLTGRTKVDARSWVAADYHWRVACALFGADAKATFAIPGATGEPEFR
jgi:hypothetical protein